MSRTTMVDSFATCFNCGADFGLHHYETNQCPVGGVEETRVGKVQQWAETKFIDAKEEQVRQAAPELLGTLQLLAEHIRLHDIPIGSGMWVQIQDVIKKATE